MKYFQAPLGCWTLTNIGLILEGSMTIKPWFFSYPHYSGPSSHSDGPAGSLAVMLQSCLICHWLPMERNTMFTFLTVLYTLCWAQE